MKEYQYDVFISHAVEDKLGFANDLDEALKAKGLTVWYSGKELSVGDRLADTLYDGLDLCRFGVVLISPNYLSKIWPLAEFFTLHEKQRAKPDNIPEKKRIEKVILPILYNITAKEVAEKFPLMADIFALQASSGIEPVTEKLYTEIQKIKKREGENKNKGIGSPRLLQLKRKYFITPLILVALVTSSFYGRDYFFPNMPAPALIKQSIEYRIAQVSQRATVDVQKTIELQAGKRVAADVTKKLYSEFLTAKSYYRNEYALNTILQNIHSRKNVAANLKLDTETFSPLTQFNLKSPMIYQYTYTSTDHYRKEAYVFCNVEPVTYTITNAVRADADHYTASVTYRNNIRTVHTNLVFPSSYNDTKHYQLSITALKPEEVYHFKKEDDVWVLEKIE